MFRRIYIKWLVWRGKAVDIWSKSSYPSDVLSNLCSNGFRFDGVVCGSMEGFLQSLKQKDKDKQRQICSMKGKNAKKMTSTGWQTGPDRMVERSRHRQAIGGIPAIGSPSIYGNV